MKYICTFSTISNYNSICSQRKPPAKKIKKENTDLSPLFEKLSSVTTTLTNCADKAMKEMDLSCVEEEDEETLIGRLITKRLNKFSKKDAAEVTQEITSIVNEFDDSEQSDDYFGTDSD